MRNHAEIAGLVFLISTWLIDAAPAETTELPSVGESSVVIINKGDRDINFAIRPRDGQWANYTVETGYNTKISCHECTTESFEIQVNTEGKSVDYVLPANGRYSIEWNSSRGMWDVFKARE